MVTPFGSLLRYFRNQRGIALKALAAKIHISPKVLYALESGIRRPPTGDDLLALSDALSLRPNEARALAEAAQDSVTTLRIPRAATAREYRLAHQLFRHLGRLSDEQIDGIETLLKDRKLSAIPGGNMT